MTPTQGPHGGVIINQDSLVGRPWRHGGGKRSGRMAATEMAAFAFAVVTVGVPLWLLVMNSFKSESEAAFLSLGLPSEWRIVDNYSTIIDKAHVARGLLNNLIVIAPSIFLILLLAPLAAWPLARHSSRSSRFWYTAAIAGIFFPPSMVPILLTERALHIDGSYLGLVLYYVGAHMPFAVFMVTGFIKAIPRELEEAARLDGAGIWETYVTILLPLLRPILATVFVLLIFGMWNDFYSPIFLLRGQDQQTLVLSLYDVAQQDIRLVRYNLVFAFIVLLALPLLGVMIAMYRQLTEGLTHGAGR